MSKPDQITNVTYDLGTEDGRKWFHHDQSWQRYKAAKAGGDIVERLRREGRVYTHMEAALRIETLRNLLREVMDSEAVAHAPPGWIERAQEELANHVR